MTQLQGDKLPTLDTQRLRLRWLEARDVPALFTVFSDARVMRYWSTPPWTDEAQGAKLVENVHRLFADGTLYQWGIAKRDDNEIIGTCTLAQIDERNRRAEIGFILGHAHWRQGYATEALRTLINFAFDEMNLHRIEADVDPRNESSIKLLERLGFQREGLLRERWLVGDEINDTVFYGLLRSEWPTT